MLHARASTVTGDTQALRFGREICGDLAVAERREWLVTDGLGGYAAGTVAGSLTRRYHGLLIAALAPPLGRTLMLSRLEDSIVYAGTTTELSCNRWASGAVSPRGYAAIETFELDGSIPTWTFACGDALIEKQIWMESGEPSTYVRYVVRRASSPVKLRARALVAYRDYHGTTRAYEPHAKAAPIERGISYTADAGAQPLYLRAQGVTCTLADEWYVGIELPAEAERGLDAVGDHLHVATFEVTLNPGYDATFVAGTRPDASLVGRQALERRRAHDRAILDRFEAASEARLTTARAAAGGTYFAGKEHASGNGSAGANGEPDVAPATPIPSWVQSLALAADQFIVARESASEPGGRTVIAGYPWFGDWGRDTMIALPGLTLVTGDTTTAASILRTFARYVSEGMLPNRFPDAGETPEYNTADATLWYFEAVRAYYALTRDAQLLAELFPVLESIVEHHVKGTRFGIGVDPNDGLLRAGETGVQLTWMDAKVGDWVVTPRIGKPVEINALWYNALRTMEWFAPLANAEAKPYGMMAKRAAQNFERFWNIHAGYCFDVIDGPDGNDPALRPNQLIAVSLYHRPFDRARETAIVDACSKELLTSYGLRSLAPGDSSYTGRYTGDQRARDGAYHQGTVWAWLMGPFISAHLRAHGDVNAARRFLAPIADHVRDYGLGSIAEIFEGDAPFTPRGCTSQAWSVSEYLRVWAQIEAFEAAAQPLGARTLRPPAVHAGAAAGRGAN